MLRDVLRPLDHKPLRTQALKPYTQQRRPLQERYVHAEFSGSALLKPTKLQMLAGCGRGVEDGQLGARWRTPEALQGPGGFRVSALGFRDGKLSRARANLKPVPAAQQPITKESTTPYRRAALGKNAFCPRTFGPLDCRNLQGTK